MLAFNLGVFFRNLAGAEVDFSAKDGETEVHFQGMVESIHQESGLEQHLQVTLRRDTLRCRIGILEPEDEEQPSSEDEPKVEVTLEADAQEEHPVLLYRGQFKFDSISFKPRVPPSATDSPDQEQNEGGNS